MPAAGGRPMTLLEGSSHVWDRSARRLYYVNQQSTGGTRIEGAEIQPGTELPVVARVWVAGVSTGTLRDLALAPDGTRLLASGADESANLTRVRLTPDGGDVAGPEDLSTGHVRDRYPPYHQTASASSSAPTESGTTVYGWSRLRQAAGPVSRCRTWQRNEW